MTFEVSIGSARRAVVVLSVAGTILGASLPAQASEPAQKAMAQTLFEQARELIKDRRFAEACPKLEQSLRLDAGTGTMLWLADCYENAGQSASAWVQFKEAAAAAALNQDPREKIARKRVADLEARLTTLVIVVQPGERTRGLEIRRDGVIVSDVELGVASPIDPGVHSISASSADRETWTMDVDVPAQPKSVRVEVPALRVLERPAIATPAPPPPASESLEPIDSGAMTAPTSSWTPLRVFGISLAGVGAASLGVGAFLGLRAKSTYDSSNKDGHCSPTNECDAAGKERRAEAGGLATGSTIAFGVGILGLVTGGVLYFAAPRRAKPIISVLPVIGPRDAGLLVQRHF